MEKETYQMLENHMLSCMKDSAHDKEHIYRVLYTALEIAEAEENVDYDVLICACLLHDIARQEQFDNPNVCHAQTGGEKAYRFLMEHGFTEQFAEHVKACIQAHRYRNANIPRSIEAKILFDADKLDVTGAIGIARTLLYKGHISEPIYSLLPDGSVSDGSEDICPSFFKEYKHKLERLYGRFFTKKGEELAEKRRKAATVFYQSLLCEVKQSYENGVTYLEKYVKK